MDHPRSFYVIALSLVCALGLVLKAATMPSVAMAGTADLAYLDIDRQLQRHGFTLIGVHRATTDGNFRVRLYKTDYCRRPVLLLPLKRNAEGALILRSKLAGGWREPKFVLDGKSYANFPTLQLWWRQFASALQVWDNDRRTPVVWTVAESTACNGSQPFHKLLS